MHTLTRTGPGRALLAAVALILAAGGYATPLAAAVAIATGVHLYRRLRRWRPPPGVLASAGLALVCAGAAL